MFYVRARHLGTQPTRRHLATLAAGRLKFVHLESCYLRTTEMRCLT